MITFRVRAGIVSPFKSKGGTIRGAIDKPASFRNARLVRGNISISCDLAAADFALWTAQIERRIVPRQNLSRGRVIRTDVAGHAALGFSHERDRSNQLGGLVSVTRR